MRLINLGKPNLSAKVSDLDYARVTMYKWRAITPYKVTYAYRSWYAGALHRIEYLHNFILGAKYIDHRNGDGLDAETAYKRAANKLHGRFAFHKSRP